MTTWIEPQPIVVPDAIRQVIPVGGDLGALIAALLVRRGIADALTARGFLDPGAYTPAPALDLSDLAETVGRLQRAIASQERIVVWGDFDVDGLTATALYVQALGDLGANVTFHIPTRRQSHGVHPVGVQRLIDAGAQVLLTADTGVAAHPAVDLAMGQGVDVLVTDHHDLPMTLPAALTVVNPRRLPDGHPLSELPGVGVAYQVVRALYDAMGRSDVERFLDLVALGIVADVATLYADVRYLLQRGLGVLRRTTRPGLAAVMQRADLNPAYLDEEDIGFSLAPRLNAISRVGEGLDAGSGVELLTTDDRTRGGTIANHLESLNAKRRWLTKQTFEAVLDQLERDRTLQDGPAVVVAGANWDPGIVGIVAGRLAERFNKPAIVLSAPAQEMARGSARSVQGIDIHAAIAAQQHLLYRCGGHPMAAGLSLESERIAEFRRGLWRTLERTAPPPAEREVQIDAYLDLDRISLDLVRGVNLLGPFGPGNERPIFVARGLDLVSSAVIGRTREHRRLVVRDKKGGEHTVLWWRSADQPLPEGQFDLAFTVGINTFRAQETVQLTWVDARLVVPVAIEKTSLKPAIRVLHDYRTLTRLESPLRALVTPQTLVWAEGTASIDDIGFCDRTRLRQAETLVIWTIPPGPAVLHGALEKVAPRQVVLFAVNPGLDTPRSFFVRLGGLIKHIVLRGRDARVGLSTLAAQMAHRESTVSLGLEWLALQGQVEVEIDREAGQVTLSAVQGGKSTPRQVDREHLDALQGRLLARLEETASYRDYFCGARANRLLHV